MNHFHYQLDEQRACKYFHFCVEFFYFCVARRNWDNAADTNNPRSDVSSRPNYLSMAALAAVTSKVENH